MNNSTVKYLEITLAIHNYLDSDEQHGSNVTTCSFHDLPPHEQYVTYHLHSVNPPTAGIQSDSHKIIEAKVVQNII